MASQHPLLTSCPPSGELQLVTSYRAAGARSYCWSFAGMCVCVCVYLSVCVRAVGSAFGRCSCWRSQGVVDQQAHTWGWLQGH